MAKILKGIESIRKYIDPDNPISKDKVVEFIKMGMPARKIGEVWYAHTDNVDDFFKSITRVDMRKAPPEVFYNGE